MAFAERPCEVEVWVGIDDINPLTVRQLGAASRDGVTTELERHLLVRLHACVVGKRNSRGLEVDEVQRILRGGQALAELGFDGLLGTARGGNMDALPLADRACAADEAIGNLADVRNAELDQFTDSVSIPPVKDIDPIQIQNVVFCLRELFPALSETVRFRG